MVVTLQSTNQNLAGSVAPNTFVMDVSLIADINVNSDEFKELLVRLYQALNRLAIVVNSKESGYYPLNEFVTGQQYFPNPSLSEMDVQNYRPVTRVVINFGALPNTGTKSVAHNITITSSTTFTHIYGTSSDTTGNNYIPLPYASPTAANNIELKVSATNVTVITGSNRSNFTTTYIVLEFMNY